MVIRGVYGAIFIVIIINNRNSGQGEQTQSDRIELFFVIPNYIPGMLIIERIFSWLSCTILFTIPVVSGNYYVTQNGKLWLSIFFVVDK